MKDIMDVVKVLFVIGFIIFLAGSCSDSENQRMESKLKDAMDEGYRAGYDAGYDVGYKRGAEDQLEECRSEYTIDGRSICDISNAIRRAYGVTPGEAFNIIEEYNYDSSHGGYTWDEKENAIQAIYATASIFPSDY